MTCEVKQKQKLLASSAKPAFSPTSWQTLRRKYVKNNLLFDNCHCSAKHPYLLSCLAHEPDLIAMTDRRIVEENGRAKRQKTTDSDPSSNPYLAHMYPEGEGDEGGYENGYSNGNGAGIKSSSNGAVGAGLKGLKRHSTTAAQASAVEDGPLNPFNGAPLSQRYFGILKTRRNLPVHAQR